MLGTVGFVVFGTLYDVVPFIVWVHRYSDRLGLEPVPMIDDLYSDRLATTDGLLLGTGTLALVLTDWVGGAASLTALSGVLICVGSLAFAANLLLVVHNHSPQSLGQLLLGATERDRTDVATTE